MVCHAVPALVEYAIKVHNEKLEHGQVCFRTLLLSDNIPFNTCTRVHIYIHARTQACRHTQACTHDRVNLIASVFARRAGTPSSKPRSRSGMHDAWGRHVALNMYCVLCIP